MNNYPIILAHGIARFDFLLANFIKNLGPLGSFVEVATDGINYFKGIARRLRKNGFDVYHSSVSFAAGLPRRAEDLAGEVNRVLELKGCDKVHIIAHSMGGLDARYMIARLGMSEKICSLTTIGTPHLGTSFADWGFEHRGSGVIELLKPLIDLDGFLALTTSACREFNDSAAETEAANPVVYQTYASQEPQNKVFTLLQPSWEIIAQAEGANDGLVSHTSQRWQPELIGAGGQRKQIAQHDFPVSADHLNEVGWWDINQFDIPGANLIKLAQEIKQYESSIKDVYLKIARDVAAL
ncbi:MAG: hypothetical protein AUG51_18830 [Acidobacteria bacterium 13_1_20CM_3_53_8]|nr:MAG: hypothetical protein AUG51_18830 [Acidobacteria bacterium 13_1_20CM_3_53_8]